MTTVTPLTLPAEQTSSPTGSPATRLIVVRGNSGAGKSSVAQALRAAYGRGLAWVGQDNLRRVVLREWDRPGAPNIGLIDLTARYALDAGYHVVVDGILAADRYDPMLAGLRGDHQGTTCFYYLDVTAEESFRRHATRPQAAEFTTDDMREWFRTRDLLPSVAERVVPQSSTLVETVELILSEPNLLAAPRPAVAEESARKGHPGHARHT